MAVPVFMVITGYLSALSLDRKGSMLADAYNPREIMSKCIRFLLPYTIIYIIQVAISAIFGLKVLSCSRIIHDYVLGGDGPGSYYTLVMIQIVFMIPIINVLIRRYKLKGLIGCFLFNVFFEIVKHYCNMGGGAYRLCSLRYVFILSYGVYLYYYCYKKRHMVVFCGVGLIGLSYIIVFNYTNIKPVFTDLWTVTSVFAVMYIVPIMMILIQCTKISNRFFELLGKASFNIFLVQMTYYWAFANFVYNMIESVTIRLLISFLICISVGIAFYKIEAPFTQRIIEQMRLNK